jgi:hypothetical protein
MNPAELRQAASSIRDWWHVSLPEIEMLAHAMVGPREEGWVRKGLHRAIVAKHKFGAEAATLGEEFTALSADVSKLRNNTAQSVVISAAFYHVRFENIHPFYDGNGRVGRLILMGQIRQSLGFSPIEFERRLALERDAYRAAFKLDGGPGTFRGVAMLLSRITGVPLDAESLNLNLQLGPLRQSKGKPKRG